MYEVHCKRISRKGRKAFAMGASQKSRVDRNNSPHSVDVVATSPLQGRGIVFAKHWVLPEGSADYIAFRPPRPPVIYRLLREPSSSPPGKLYRKWLSKNQ